MKLLTYLLRGEERIGALVNDTEALDILSAAQRAGMEPSSHFDCMLNLIAAGDTGLDQVRALLAAPFAECIVSLNDVEVLAPIPVPAQVRDFLAFEKHFQQAIHSSLKMQALADGKDPDESLKTAQETGADAIPSIWYERPIYYKANRFATTGQDQTVTWPSYSQLMDYECELACVIGRGGRDIPASEASSHIFGFMIFNDLSARDAQAADMQGMMGPAKGKDFDQGNPMGPYLVTIDEVKNAYDLEMIVRVNGQEMSRGSSSTMHWTFEQMIEFVSQSETLFSGEVFGSGTVGDGCGLEHMLFLSDGDVIELEISGLGILRTTIKRTS